MSPFAFAALLTAGLVMPFGSAWAAATSAALSYEWYRASSEQQSQALVGLAALSTTSSDVLVGGLRFDDEFVGDGWGAVIGGRAAIAASCGMRALATGFIGDGEYRAWRIKAGPQFDLEGRTVWTYYQHDASNLGSDADHGAFELSVPLAGRYSGKLQGSYGRSAGVTTCTGSAGVGWSPLGHVELSGAAGLARNGIVGSTAPSSADQGVGRPLDGSRAQRQSAGEDVVSVTLSLGVRVLFP